MVQPMRARFDPGRLAAIYAGRRRSAPSPGSASPRRPRTAPTGWPWATFAANLAGALLLGLFVAALRGHREREPRLRPPHHRPLRDADHLRHPAARALRDGRRRQHRPRARLRRGDDRRRPAPPPRRPPPRRRSLCFAHTATKAPARGGGDERRGLDRGGAARRARGGRPLRARRARSPTALRTPFPLGILAVNLAGTLVLGIAAGAALGGEALTIVAGGVTGSFTTFSTWMLDTERLAEAGRGEPRRPQRRPLAGRRLRRRRRSATRSARPSERRTRAAPSPSAPVSTLICRMNEQDADRATSRRQIEALAPRAGARSASSRTVSG